MNKNKSLRRMILTALFTAIAIVLVYVNFPIFPQVSFLRYDFGDIPILIVTLMFGPVYGILSTVIVSAYQALSLSADGWFGGLMHVLGTGALVVPSGIIFTYFKKKREKSTDVFEYSELKYAIIGLLTGCICMILSMLLFNYLLDPLFYGMPTEAVVTLLPWIVLFNCVKAFANSAITISVYKHVIRLIEKID